MADGYARATGKTGVCIAQNGPGITNFVTGVAAAYWAHTPVVVITPETGSLGQGLGGFQEMSQLPTFSEITKYQAHVCSPKRWVAAAGPCNMPPLRRLAEFTNRCFNYAQLERGPVQLNIPRDHFYGDVQVTSASTLSPHTAGAVPPPTAPRCGSPAR
jgi:sulfoacetaldehyde acetyltransferase